MIITMVAIQGSNMNFTRRNNKISFRYSSDGVKWDTKEVSKTQQLDIQNLPVYKTIHKLKTRICSELKVPVS